MLGFLPDESLIERIVKIYDPKQTKMKNNCIVYKGITLVLFTVLYYNGLKAQLQETTGSGTQWTTVGELKWLSNTKASLKYTASLRDTVYLLSLQDEQKLQNSRGSTVYQYFSIRYNGVDNTTEKLYQLLISFFADENRKNKDYEKTFRLGNEAVLVRHYPKLIATTISFSTTKNTILFTEKEVKKLFGKL